MGGFSVVVNPRGEMVVEAAADEPCIIYADIDATTAVQWREKFRWLDDRREY
jgi:predicted amidohydrolase